MTIADANVVLDFCGLAPERTERSLEASLLAVESSERFVVTEAVLAEVFWVLTTTYSMPSRHSVALVESILSSSEFEAWDPAAADYAFNLKRRVPGLSILDCLLAARVVIADEKVFTHDRRLKRIIKTELERQERP